MIYFCLLLCIRLNPVFSEETHSTFVLHCMAKDLYDAKGLFFQVKDWDRIGSNDELGTVQVSAGKLYNATGQDMEFKITPPIGKEFEDAGTLMIRCSATTVDDRTGEKKKILGFTAPQFDVPKITAPKMGGLFSGRSAEPEEPKPMLIEIVSCRKLLGADKTGLSDPYVSIRLGNEKLHETKHVPQTLEPIFEVKHKPFYVLEKNPVDVKQHGGVLFKVKDYDFVGKSDDLGEILVDPDTLYNATGQKVELKLNPPKGHAEDAGYITLRIRPATDDDMAKSKSIFGGMSYVPKTDYGPKDLSLLIEIVSGWELPIADLTSSGTYERIASLSDSFL
jgi:Ca2+-dependent lipid-binding protein